MNINEATRQINIILAELETTTGQHAEGIRISNIEVTDIASVRRELSRSVEIELKPIPGSHWET